MKTGWVALLALLILLARRVHHACKSSHLEPTSGSRVKAAIAFLLVQLSSLFRRRRLRPVFIEDRQFHNSDHECYNDSFYWWGNTGDARDSDGKRHSFCVTTRLGFHGRNAQLVTPWLVIDLDGTSYELPKEFVRNSASLHGRDRQISASDGNSTLMYCCERALDLWRLSYTGRLQVTGSAEQVDAKLELQVQMISLPFHYQANWDPMTVAKAMSAEPWSLEFFRHLRSEHQEHYEIGTTMTGTVTIESSAQHSAQVCINSAPGFRDRSFGKRDWTFMQRYIWCGTLSLREPLRVDGKHYTHLTATAVNYGLTFRHLVAGGLMGTTHTLALTGMSHMGVIAEEWYNASTRQGCPIGHRIPKQLHMEFQFDGEILMSVKVTRDGWRCGFLMQDGCFEVHEGTAVYHLECQGQQVLADGLLEFGAVLSKD